MIVRSGLADFVRSVATNRSGSGSVVEHVLAKDGVAGSNPVFRSISLPAGPYPDSSWQLVAECRQNSRDPARTTTVPRCGKPGNLRYTLGGVRS